MASYEHRKNKIDMKTKITKAFIILIVVFVIIVTLLAVIVLRKQKMENSHSLQYYVRSHRRLPVRQGDVVYIASWMTFDYINKAFDLPSIYLEKRLVINDARYPFVTLQKYAKDASLNSALVIQGVRESVREYVASSTPR